MVLELLHDWPLVHRNDGFEGNHIGRYLLAGDHFLEQWNIDLTTRAKKVKYGELADLNRQHEVEESATEFLLKDLCIIDGSCRF